MNKVRKTKDKKKNTESKKLSTKYKKADIPWETVSPDIFMLTAVAMESAAIRLSTKHNISLYI